MPLLKKQLVTAVRFTAFPPTQTNSMTKTNKQKQCAIYQTALSRTLNRWTQLMAMP